MNNIDSDFWEFIELNAGTDINKLILSQKNKVHSFDLKDAILQIECRKKYQGKLSKFITGTHFLFPDSISGEQSSHQAIAFYHSSLASSCKNILDMTCGLGIDSLSFAHAGINVTAIDIDPHKVSTLNKNAATLGSTLLKAFSAESIEFLRNSNENYDLIFVDPSRRDDSNKRLYNLKDCSPDIIENQNLLLQHSSKVLIKASPLLDISKTLKDFHNISAIRLVGVKGECKEILVELSSDNSLNTILFEAIDLDNEGSFISSFSKKIPIKETVEKEQYVNFALEEDLKPGNFLLEPSAMMMKLAFWEDICIIYNAKKIGKSSHLFVTDKLPKDFPGRVTKIDKCLTKKDRKSLCGFPASVVSRNYPLSSDEIRKSLKLKEGDENFLYATRLGKYPILLLTKSETIPG